MLSFICAAVDGLGLIQRSLNSVGDFLQTPTGLDQRLSPPTAFLFQANFCIIFLFKDF